MTGVLLQVRLGSTRLPGKALLPLADRPLIEHAMRSLRRLPASVHAILTDKPSAAHLGESAERCGYRLFAGSPEDVLDRYVCAARQFDVDTIVRATGDNPLVSWELARMALCARGNADYFAWDGPPLGTGVEIVQRRALEQAHAETASEYDREHVCPYLYGNPQLFTCRREQCPPAYRLPDRTVTVDTAEDYEAMQQLFLSVYDGDPVPVLRLVRHLRGAT